MCYHYGLKADKSALEKRYKASLLFDLEQMESLSYANAFAHPIMPIVCSDNPSSIIGGEWGLLPQWARDKSFQKNTVNARLETIHEKPSFRMAIGNRCLIPFTYFYEWKWLDAKGKQKEKYALSMPSSAIYSFAGLYSDWVDTSTGAVIRTYTILTTEATSIMAEIHNTKQRMPIIIDPTSEWDYLLDGRIVLANHQILALLAD